MASDEERVVEAADVVVEEEEVMARTPPLAPFRRALTSAIRVLTTLLDNLLPSCSISSKDSPVDPRWGPLLLLEEEVEDVSTATTSGISTALYRL